MNGFFAPDSSNSAMFLQQAETLGLFLYECADTKQFQIRGFPVFFLPPYYPKRETFIRKERGLNSDSHASQVTIETIRPGLH